MVAVAIVSLSFVSQATPMPSDSLPRRGDKVILNADLGFVPYFRDEAGYRAFLAAVKVNTPESITGIKKTFRESLFMTPSGTETEVVLGVGDVTDERTTPRGKAPPLASIVNPSLVPLIAIKRPGKSGTVLVPAIYVRPDGSRPYPVELKFPVIVPYMDPTIAPRAGLEMCVIGPDGNDAPAVSRPTSYMVLSKAAKAGDRVGMRKLLDERKIEMLSTGTMVLVIERHTNPYLVGDLFAAEVRVIEGPLAGTAFWIPDSYLSVPTFELLTHQTASRMLKADARRRKASAKGVTK